MNYVQARQHIIDELHRQNKRITDYDTAEIRRGAYEYLRAIEAHELAVQLVANDHLDYNSLYAALISAVSAGYRIGHEENKLHC